jgi:hypothetical protein
MARDQLFAGAAFSLDQNARFGETKDALYFRDNFSNGSTFADETGNSPTQSLIGR